MKGYKGMTRDMTCREMKFEIGKTYHVDGKICLCENGLHFCERLIDVVDFYKNDGNNRYFEIEADGIIKTDGKKSVTSSLTVIREINDIELNRVIYGCGYGDSYGHGYGNGNGDGHGYGYGNGCGDGYGYVNGNEYSNEYSYNYGDGNGDGNGYGYSNGYGNGCGYGTSNIQRIIKLA